MNTEYTRFLEQKQSIHNELDADRKQLSNLKQKPFEKQQDISGKTKAISTIEKLMDEISSN